VLVVSDSVGVTGSLPDSLNVTVAFPLTGQGRPPQTDVFAAQYTARLCLCERFAGTVAVPTHHSRPRRLARSCLVRLFHSQLSSGLCRRTRSPLVFLAGDWEPFPELEPKLRYIMDQCRRRRVEQHIQRTPAPAE
jgi:hypothetical protein